MLHGSKVYILALLQAFLLAKLTESAMSSCPRDEKCTRLASCSPLMQILKPSGMTQAERDVFAHRQCDLDPHGDELLYKIYVCCPELGDVLPSNQSCGPTPPEFPTPSGGHAVLNEYPWLALLLYENRLSLRWDQETSCVGSLINSRYVLTAAHCVTGDHLTHKDLVVKSVRLGEHNKSTNPDCITLDSGHHHCAPPHLQVNLEQVIVHHGFFSMGTTFLNDIALLRLQFPVRYTKQIRPICLVDADTHLQGLRIASWDATGGIRTVIMTTMKERNPYDCLISYPHFHPVSQMCASGERERDTCVGMSGSPLMGIKERNLHGYFFLAGISTYGQQPCYSPGVPEFYTKTGYFLEWIKANLAP
ncbi:spaetzle-processing enzyme [Drosophila santomea]|uniref:spaetzle-processing enzyme n=1 Tax=Drosophila santomea TaxID=129105 RepID=UPI001952FC2D|nr:spaetzle-processing enzyme [Drosophila santomea]